MGYYKFNTGADVKTEALARIISDRTGAKPATILVIGCGSGADAQALARIFDAYIDAIDLENYFRDDGDPRVRFRVMNASALNFKDESFDFVYTFHALEHIADPMQALAEIRRVLRPNGVYCIGTPNRNRLVGYVGVPDLPLRTKLYWNYVDWSKRLCGRFRNEYGAHAGFSRPELEEMCRIIGPGNDIADEYYKAIYKNESALLQFLICARLERIAWPSVYVVGRKA